MIILPPPSFDHPSTCPRVSPRRLLGNSHPNPWMMEKEEEEEVEEEEEEEEKEKE